MYQHLCIPINTFIEFVVRVRRLVDADLVRHDEAWFGAAGDDEVS